MAKSRFNLSERARENPIGPTCFDILAPYFSFRMDLTLLHKTSLEKLVNYANLVGLFPNKSVDSKLFQFIQNVIQKNTSYTNFRIIFY